MSAKALNGEGIDLEWWFEIGGIWVFQALCKETVFNI